MLNKIGYMLLVIVLFSCKEKEKSKSDSRIDRLPLYNEAIFTPNWISKSDKSLKTFHRIPPFKFVNQNGEAVTE